VCPECLPDDRNSDVYEQMRQSCVRHAQAYMKNDGGHFEHLW